MAPDRDTSTTTCSRSCTSSRAPARAVGSRRDWWAYRRLACRRRIRTHEVARTKADERSSHEAAETETSAVALDRHSHTLPGGLRGLRVLDESRQSKGRVSDVGR